jgi:bifunctional DNA-binding transcriptional regulator/antitoxin component of YhaV-PrlF toxin-antitoxin module
MYLRRLYKYNSTLGLTLPKEITKHLKLNRGDYLELWIYSPETVIFRKHEIPKKPVGIPKEADENTPPDWEDEQQKLE